MAEQYDLVVIGAGPGGYTAAIKAAQMGLKTVIVEKNRLGGTCVNQGCIPTKSLLYASNLFRMMQNSDEFGVSAEGIAFDFNKMQHYKRESVRRYRDGIEEKFQELGLKLVSGRATLRRDRTVEVELNEGGREYYQGANVIIAIGAKPIKNSIPGIDLKGVWDSDRLLAAENWNFDRLVIMGGGVISVEMATIFNNLCSRVTIVEKQRHLMAPMDEVMAKQLERELREQGIEVYCGATVTEIQEEGNSLCCTVTPEEEGEPFQIHGCQVLSAIGRRPDLSGLCGPDVILETKNGKISVSKDFETSQLMGVKINSVISMTFIIGSFLAAIGSVLYFTNYNTVIQTSGAMPGLKAFVAAVFGGIGSVPGAVVGAFIIGICESIIKGLDVILLQAGLTTQMLGLSTFSDAFTFALLIVILIVKPTGLFGEKTTDKV